MAKIYENIVSLPLERFILCVVENTLKPLVISGRPGKKRLEDAWANIKSEYFDKTASMVAKKFIRQQADLSLLVSKIRTIKITASLLISCWDMPEEKEKLAQVLNELGRTRFKFSDVKDIERAIQRTSFLNLKLEILKHEIKETEKVLFEKKQEPTFEYFANQLITLGDFAKYQLRADSITTFEYCERLRRFNKYIKDAR